MSFSLFRSALRLHGSRFLHLPRSRAARFGLFTGAAVVTGALYLNSQYERIVMSDEFTMDPPMPPELDYDFRMGLFALREGSHDFAWTTLMSVWDRAEASGEQAMVLVHIAHALSRADPDTGDGEAQFSSWQRVVAITLRALLRTGLNLSLERAMAAGFAVSMASASPDEESATPFLQWASAQSLQVTREGLDMGIEALFDRARMMSEEVTTSCMPVLFATLAFYDPLTVTNDGVRLRPTADSPELVDEERIMLAHVYLFLGFQLLDRRHEWPVVARLQRRALALLDGTDESLVASVVSVLALQLGLQSQELGDGHGAFQLYLLAKACSPPGTPSHDAATEAIMHFVQILDEEQEQSDP